MASILIIGLHAESRKLETCTKNVQNVQKMKSTGRPYQGDDLPKIKFLKMSKTKELWPKMGQKWSKNDFRA